MQTGYIIKEDDSYTIYQNKELAKKRLDIIFDKFKYASRGNELQTIELEWIDEDCFYVIGKNDIGQLEFERKFMIESVDIVEREGDIDV